MDQWSDKAVDNLCLDVVKGIFHSPGCGVAGHQIKDFDHFVEHDIQQTLSHLQPVSAMAILRDKDPFKYSISFDHAHLGKPASPFVEKNKDGEEVIPPLTPNQARLKGMNYSSTLFIRMTLKKTNQASQEDQIIEQRLVPFGRIPIMVGSKRCHTYGLTDEEKICINECTTDAGGYFIINGAEKVLMGQERSLTHNLVYVSPVTTTQSTFTHKAEIRCIPEKGRNANRTSNTSIYITKLTGNTQLQNITADRTRAIRVTLPQLPKTRLPIVILLKALGCDDEKKIHQYLSFLPKPMLEYCIGEAQVSLGSKTKVTTVEVMPSLFSIHQNADPENYRNRIVEDALEHIGRQSLLNRQGGIEHPQTYYIDRAREILGNEFMPQISNIFDEKSNLQKLHFLSYATRRLYSVSTGKEKADDRDHLAYKRVDLASTLLSSILRSSLDNAIKMIGRLLFRSLDNTHWTMDLKRIAEPYGTFITGGFEYSIASGRWGDKNLLSAYGVPVRIGITQPINRFMPLAALSQLRKVNTPVGRDTKLSAPRQLHGSHFGFYCVHGNTLVLMGDGKTKKPIKDINPLMDQVMTVNPKTLKQQASSIHNFFSMMPEEFLSITILNGTEIKVSADHPFLVRNDIDDFIWIKAGDLDRKHHNIVYHYTPTWYTEDTNEEIKQLFMPNLFTRYNLIQKQHLLTLKKMRLIDTPVTDEATLSTISSLCGAIMSGKGEIVPYKGHYRVEFLCQEKYDSLELNKDIASLGFSPISPQSLRHREGNVWKLAYTGAFVSFVEIVLENNNVDQGVKHIPQWIVRGKRIVRQAFLSALSNERIIAMGNNLSIQPFMQCFDLISRLKTLDFVRQVQNLFADFQIETVVYERTLSPQFGIFYLHVVDEMSNLGRYVQNVGYTYNIDNRIASVIPTQYIQYANHQAMTSRSRPLSFHRFLALVDQIGDKSIQPIVDIKHIKPETVYDFTTISSNHSFIGNGIVISNCPSETPEGHSCGLVKTLSILTKVSIQILDAVPDLIQIIHKFFARFQIPYLNQLGVTNTEMNYKIIISGHWHYELDLNDANALHLVQHLRSFRRCLQFSHEIGIALFTSRKEIHIQLDGGRLLRPLWIAENFLFQYNNTLSAVQEIIAEGGDVLQCLLENGYIEYVGADEEESVLCCENLLQFRKASHTEQLSYTHIEVHGVTILGLCALDVPFSNYSQAPRVSYQCLHHEEEIVMADNTHKSIKDIKVGEIVLTFDTDTLLCEPSQVLHQYVKQSNKDMVEVFTDTGNKLRVTEDHSFWTEKGWIQAKNLLGENAAVFKAASGIGSYNQKGDAIFVKITKVRKIEQSIISDITVANPHHTFITASGFGVHNSSMMKQAIGTPALNLEHRFDAVTHVLHYPQKPLNSSSRWLYTKQNSQQRSDDRNERRKDDDIASMYGANGQNAIVAICSWSGYNQEDSLILNQSAIDRGLFHSTVLKTTIDNQKAGETYKQPDRKYTTQIKFAQYNKLDTAGIAPPGTHLLLNDAYVGKTAHLSEVECGFKERDVSTVLRSSDHQNHVVDAVCIAEEENYSSNVAYYDIHNISNNKTSKGRLSEDSEILTDDGWKSHDTIDITKHKVATLVDGTLSYEFANAKTAFHYEGEMYHIRRGALDLLVTPNHKMYVGKRTHIPKDGYGDYQFIEAIDLFGKSVRYKKDAINLNGEYLFCLPDIPNANRAFRERKIVIKAGSQMDAWCQFFGWYISDGWVSTTDSRVTHISQRKVNFTSQLEMTLQKLGMTCYFENNTYRVFSRQLWTYLNEIKDRLPEWVWRLSTRQARLLIKAMIYGDGHIHANGSEGYYTTSVQLRDDFQRLCLHAGWACDYFKSHEAGREMRYADQIVIAKYDLWRCGIQMDSRCRPCTRLRQKPVDDSLICEEWRDYDDLVWCVEVPSHVFYMRRNGKTCWTGNSSRHGQKGTCGMTFRQEDMPFTSYGMTPDIIMNPHAIPSRMTIGHLIECLASKEAVLSGSLNSSIPFTSTNSSQMTDSDRFKTVEEIAADLDKLGYKHYKNYQADNYGNETLYNPLTGRKMRAKIFIGPTFYQKLRHMVGDKCHARSFGKNEILTRQPVEGRARDGGFRFGEMERDAVLAHGASSLMIDRLKHNSDLFIAPVCTICGLIAISKLNDQGPPTLSCNRCKNLLSIDAPVKMVASGYCYKMLTSELLAMNICPRILI